MQKIKKPTVRRTLRSPFRTTKEEHELIARSAFDYGPPQPNFEAPISNNEWICMMLFTPGWERRLERLRAKQRAAGLSDDLFLHQSERRKKGLRIKPGRTAWHLEQVPA